MCATVSHQSFMHSISCEAKALTIIPVAKAHLLAYESPAAANQRFLVSASNYSFQQFVDVIRTNFPELRDKTPAGEPNKPLPDSYTTDTSKVQKVLGLKFHTMEETVIDAVKSLQELEKRLT